MLDFIFMLTRNDRTVADADRHVQTALQAGVRHIGFKDIGVPTRTLRSLNRLIQQAGAASYLEVVSLDRDSELASARAAVELGVDYLLGGTHVPGVLPLLAGSAIRYYPFAGKISGHPSILDGDIDDIVASARDLSRHDGVHGLDVLAYRSGEDVPALMRAICGCIDKPVIMAGSIRNPSMISAVAQAGAAGFTIGTAALDGRFPAQTTGLAGQISAIMAAVSRANTGFPV